MSARKVSATSAGILTCGARYVAEEVLKMPRDEMALAWGRLLHEGAAEINAARMRKEDVSPEDVREVVRGLHAGERAPEAYEALNWWGERMVGIEPVVVEDEGGRWTMELDGVEVVGKWDAAWVHPETGRIVVADLKSGFMPDKEEAKRLLQMRLYALAACERFGVGGCDVMLVSLRNRFSYLLSYDETDIASFKMFVVDIAREVAAKLALVEDAKSSDASLWKLTEPGQPLQPTANVFCPRCAWKRACPVYAQRLYPSGIVRSGSRPAWLEHLREGAKFIEAEKKSIEEDLRAEAESAPLREGGYVVEVREQTQQVKAVAAHERIVRRLILTKEEQPSNVLENGPKPTTPSASASSRRGHAAMGSPAPASSVAKAASRSRTSSSRTKEVTGVSGTASLRSRTSKGGGLTRNSP